MKSRVFIGSSKESKENANKIKQYLEPDFECVVWTEFFSLNRNTYDELFRKSIAFDFAIFIGGKDDLVTRQDDGTQKVSARDNVYLEFGLYAGILTPSRSFFLFDRDCEVASDLHGITIELYSDKNELKECCEKIRGQMREEEKLNRIQLRPSTGLAIGYFENFLKPVSHALLMLDKLKVDNKVFQVKQWEKILEVKIPKNVEQDWLSFAQRFYIENDVREISLNGGCREMRVKLDGDTFSNEKKIRLLDVPQTVRAAFRALKLINGKDHTGFEEILTLAKKKEVDNFVKTLDNLIRTDACAEKYVRIEC